MRCGLVRCVSTPFLLAAPDIQVSGDGEEAVAEQTHDDDLNEAK